MRCWLHLHPSRRHTVSQPGRAPLLSVAGAGVGRCSGRGCGSQPGLSLSPLPAAGPPPARPSHPRPAGVAGAAAHCAAAAAPGGARAALLLAPHRDPPGPGRASPAALPSKVPSGVGRGEWGSCGPEEWGDAAAGLRGSSSALRPRRGGCGFGAGGSGSGSEHPRARRRRVGGSRGEQRARGTPGFVCGWELR